MSDTKVVQKDVKKPLSDATRKAIGTVGSKKREDMPGHVFLMPSEKKYPVKVKRDGEWVYSAQLLHAAAARARMQGKNDLANRADKIRERLMPSKKEEQMSTVAKQIAEEILLEMNPYHDAAGRFTSKHSATQVRNALVKDTGGIAQSNRGYNNPYSEVDQQSFLVHPDKAQHLERALAQRGFQEKDASGEYQKGVRKFENDAGHTVIVSPVWKTVTGPKIPVDVYGTKKAKRNPRPYYD